MKWIRLLFLGGCLASLVMAAPVIDVLEVNGVRYESVKFGPVNGDKIVLFHSHGVTSVPFASLPASYRNQVASQPSGTSPAAKTDDNFLPVPREVDNRTTPARASNSVTASQPSASDQAAILSAMRAQRVDSSSVTNSSGAWGSYIRERSGKVLLDGELVDRSTLTPIYAFLLRESAVVKDEGKSYTGAAVEIAERKPEAEHVAASMELRPNLWKHTDQHALLIGYRPDGLPGDLLRVYGVEIASTPTCRIFKVGTEPTFEDWKRLPH